MKDVLQPDTTSDTREVLVLGGIGGTGKPQPAIAYVIQHQHSYNSVFWSNAISEVTLKSSFLRLVQRILPP